MSFGFALEAIAVIGGAAVLLMGLIAFVSLRLERRNRSGRHRDTTYAFISTGGGRDDDGHRYHHDTSDNSGGGDFGGGDGGGGGGGDGGGGGGD